MSKLAACLDQLLCWSRIHLFMVSSSSLLSLCVSTMRVCRVPFVLWRMNDVEKVQSLRPFPLQSTSVWICVCLCVHACNKLEQDKQIQYSENIFPVEDRWEGLGNSEKGRKSLEHNSKELDLWKLKIKCEEKWLPASFYVFADKTQNQHAQYQGGC